MISALMWFGWAAPARAAPVVWTGEVNTCPAPIDFVIFGVTPNRKYAVLTGSGIGTEVVPAGPCAGVETGLAGLTYRTMRTAGGDGRDNFTVTVPSQVCNGGRVQLIDVTTCATSPAVPIRPACAVPGFPYQFCADRVSWYAAREVCASRGMRLATVDDDAEQAYLMAHSPNSTWIGFNDIQTEGTWVWDDGSPVGYTSWEPGQPDGGLAENCAALGDTTGWFDRACANPAATVEGWICES